eukprot:s2247_g3.t1
MPSNHRHGCLLLDVSAFFTCSIIAGSMFLFTSQLKEKDVPDRLTAANLDFHVFPYRGTPNADYDLLNGCTTAKMAALML